MKLIAPVLNNSVFFDFLFWTLLITDLGYDFVILNLLRTGHQSIENNANVMRRLINHCIAQGSAENIVGGVSMGGIVSRMALTKMEKELCEDHKTVMYISYDSPHKGAVIPLGLQYLANEMNRVTYTAVGDLQKRKFQLNCTAAKQMLVSHASTWGNPSNDFIALQERLAVLNYPEKCRRVSVSLGNSSTNTFDPLNANNLLLGGSAYSFGAEVLNIYDNGNLYKNVHSYVDNPYWSQDVLRLHLAYRPRIWRFRLMSEDIVNSRFFHKAGLGFDYSPGGFTSTQRGVANAFNEISGNTAHTNWRDQHCIIPVNSALDLKCNNCSTLVQNQNKAYFISNNLVPFDNIYTYDANNYNYLHDAAITPQCSTFLITEVINHMNNTNSPANSYLQSTLSTTYNFGTPYPYHNGINSVTINSGGTLKINNNTATQYGSGPIPAPSAEPFEVRTSSCSNAIVTITSGGEVVVGDASSNDHIANFIFSSQSSIVIQNGGTLTINENSKLIIKPGAKIKFETGAIINLVGANSILEIQGELNISSGATFEYTGDGFIRFSLPQATPAQAINITGSGTFDIGAASMSDKIMEVTKGYVDVAGSLTQFKLFKGTVELGTDAYIDIHSETDLQQINFKSLNSVSGHIHKGVKLNNHPASNITLKHCEFRNAQTAVSRGGTVSDALYMLGCKFYDCDRGIHTLSGGADFKALRFENCSTAAWKAENMTALSDFTGWVENCGTGIDYEADNSDADLFVYSTLFKDLTFSLLSTGDITTTVRCSKFEDNYSNISVTGGILNLSRNQTVTRIGSATGSQPPNTTGYGGDNAFINTTSEDISISSGAEDIYLDEGQNSFIYAVNPAYVIVGELTNSYYSSNNLNVTDNYWSMYQTINGIYTNINYPAPSSISVTYNTNPVSVTYSPTLSSVPTYCTHWNGEDELEEGGGHGKRADDADNTDNTTGVKGITKTNPIFKLYPNPANDVLYLKSNTTEGTTVKLIDMLVREIYLVSFTTSGNATIFSTSQFATGVYQVIVEINGSIVHKDKLVIAR